MRRIKLAVTATTFPRWVGDTQPPFVFELSKRLSQFFDISVLSPRANGSAALEEMEGLEVQRYRYLPFGWGTLAYDGGIIPKLKKSRLYYLQIPFLVFSQFFALSRLILRKRIALIHAHWIIPQGLIAVFCKCLINSKIKILVTAHGGDLLGFQGDLGAVLKRFVLKRVDCLTVVSNALHDEAIKLGCDCKIFVSPMGIDTKRFSPIHKDDSIRIIYGISGPFLLFVGRLVEKKGVEYLLKAMPKVLSAHPSTKLLIIGDGPLRQELELLSARLGLASSVIFAGSKPHDQLPAFFASADIFIGPSIVATGGDSEGFGLVFAEAMSAGTLVIASDLPAITDIVVENVTGILVRQKDSNHIAECVVEVLNSPDKFEIIKTTAREHIVLNFDWDIITLKYKNILLGIQ